MPACAEADANRPVLHLEASHAHGPKAFPAVQAHSIQAIQPCHITVLHATHSAAE